MQIETQSREELRKFGLVLAVAFTIILGLVPPLLFDRSWHWWPFALTSALAAWALLAPASLQGLYRLWMKFGLALNAVTSRIILGAVFYLLITPLGLLMRLFRGDPMDRGFDADAETYRKAPSPGERGDMNHPY